MAERVLRGSRLGAASYEADRDTDLAPRQLVAYECPNGHRFGVPMAEGAEIPGSWECRGCTAQATRVDASAPEPKKTKPPRTHWDMLMERRSVEDLEELLDERLALLHESRRKSA